MTLAQRFRRLRYPLWLAWKWFIAALHFETPMYRAWKASGCHNAGYAASSGVVVLPPSVRAQLKLPCLLVFIPDGRGGFHVYDRATLEADVERSEP